MIALVRAALLLLILSPAPAFAGAAPPEQDAFQPPRPVPVQPSVPRPQGQDQPPAEDQGNSLYVLPPPPETGIKTTEQVRLRLQDICMYQSVDADNPNKVDEATAPRCACYAQSLAKSFKPDEIAAFAATDQVPESARDRAGVAWQACLARRG